MTGYAETYRRSIERPEEFWAAAADAIDWEQRWDRVLDASRPPFFRWFPGARLSYAAHVFRNRDDSEVAIRHASELRPLGEWTWGELRARAGAVAAALRESGVVAGDRVAAYLPNISETVAAFLGCASIGLICEPLLQRRRACPDLLGFFIWDRLIARRARFGERMDMLVEGTQRRLSRGCHEGLLVK